MRISECDAEETNGFDYGTVSPQVARFLKGQAERIQRGQTLSIIQTGKSLIEAKRYLSHGQFLSWIEFEVGLHIRTAQEYMQVAQWAKGRAPIVSHLPPSLLYLLSAPSTPHDFQAELLQRLEAGERINVRTARSELRALRGKEKQTSETADTTIETETVSSPLNTELISFNQNQNASVSDAVAILSRTLSPTDFARVQNIMTSQRVLESPNLSAEIESAFRLSGLSMTRPPPSDARFNMFWPQATNIVDAATTSDFDHQAMVEGNVSPRLSETVRNNELKLLTGPRSAR
jgi:DUF3102 family protein